MNFSVGCVGVIGKMVASKCKTAGSILTEVKRWHVGCLTDEARKRILGELRRNTFFSVKKGLF